MGSLPAFAAEKHHALAMHGTPAYPQGFAHFAYTNPNAPKGGKVTLAGIGSYDSLNPFIAKGNSADHIGLIYDTLTVASADEAFTQYGLVAQSLELADDRSWIIFHLNPQARFHDGHPIDAEDVVFTFNTLMTHGSPIYKSMYGEVTKVTALSKRSVRFDLGSGENRELPLIVGQLPVLPAHYWEGKDFAKTSMEPPLGSGPYKVAKLDPGRSISYQRVNNYWATNHPVNQGKFNFDRVIIDYYRDTTVVLEALKAGDIDFRVENSSKQWATGYSGDAITQGRLVKEEIAHNNPTGMQAFVMNLRRPQFQDVRVRKALTLAFDFEWTNKQLFYGAYTRTSSYFSNSELASSGLPTGRELEILAPFKKQLPPEVFSGSFTLPVSDGKGYNRKNLRKAKQLLQQAGYEVKDNTLVHKQTGTPLDFEILLFDPAFERVVNPYAKSLSRLGINAQVRMIDISQYINRLRNFEFDMVVFSFGQSLSPGNEQISYWHSQTADVPGSRNLIGIKNPVVDALIKQVIEAPTREELIATTRALDRVLLHHYYVIPHWHIRHHRLAYWNRFGQPEQAPKYDVNFNTGFWTWWIDPAKSLAKPTTKVTDQ